MDGYWWRLRRVLASPAGCGDVLPTWRNLRKVFKTEALCFDFWCKLFILKTRSLQSLDFIESGTKLNDKTPMLRIGVFVFLFLYFYYSGLDLTNR